MCPVLQQQTYVGNELTSVKATWAYKIERLQEYLKKSHNLE